MTLDPNRSSIPVLPLHERLTVVHASASDRARLLESFPGGGTGFIDLTPEERRGITAADLAAATRALATERYAQRQGAARHLDLDLRRAIDDHEAAVSARDELLRSRRRCSDAVTWCGQLVQRLDDLHRVVQAATAETERCRDAHREAQTRLDRVREQQAAATAAIEDADQQLADLDTASLDDTAIRRQLEAVKGRLRGAEASEAEARDALNEATSRLEQLERELEELHAERARILTIRSTPLLDTEPVRATLDAYLAAAEGADPDPAGAELAAGWQALTADLDAARAAAPEVPTADDVAAAADELRAAEAVLVELETNRFRGLTGEQRAALDAAHAAVLDAEDRVARGAKGNARKELEDAREEEERLLAEAGYASYLDVVLTGGRRGKGGMRLAAEQRLTRAKERSEELRRAAEGDAEVRRLEDEQIRVWDEIVGLLGADPGDRVVALLESHPAIPREVVTHLAEALYAVGVQPIGSTLPDAADAWLRAQEELLVAHRDAGVRLEAIDLTDTDLRAQVDRLTQQVATYGNRLQQAAESVEVAQRGVESLEAELAARAGEDARRLQRLAAAEQLRAQVDAVQEALRRAATEAEADVAGAAVAVANAELSLDRAESTHAEALARLRRIADDLDPRPVDEVTLDLSVIEAITAAAEAALERASIAAGEAETAVDEATRVADAAATAVRDARTDETGISDQDRIDALSQLLDAPTGAGPALLDDSFAEVPPSALAPVLEALTVIAGHRPVVLLTDGPDVLGWAIGLPSSVASVLSADAVLSALPAGPSAGGYA